MVRALFEFAFGKKSLLIIVTSVIYGKSITMRFANRFSEFLHSYSSMPWHNSNPTESIRQTNNK